MSALSLAHTHRHTHRHTQTHTRTHTHTHTHTHTYPTKHQWHSNNNGGNRRRETERVYVYVCMRERLVDRRTDRQTENDSIWGGGVRFMDGSRRQNKTGHIILRKWRRKQICTKRLRSGMREKERVGLFHRSLLTRIALFWHTLRTSGMQKREQAGVFTRSLFTWIGLFLHG